jgi:hypothetical protein
MPQIQAWFGKKQFAEKVFILIIIAAMAARLFAIAAMPDLQLTDTAYHLGITRFVAAEHRLPLPGELPGISALPVPLYYFVTALPFALLPIPFTLETVKIFPLLFSALQLLLAFLLLRRLFPNSYLPGLAFVAVHPMLILYGSVNYVETLASVLVLLCFFVYWRFVETGKTAFALAMPFVLGATAMSKLSATVMVPAFFIMFLWELSKKKGVAGRSQKIIFFVAASLLLCSAWFAIDFLRTGVLFGANSGDLANLAAAPGRANVSLEFLLLAPIGFNEAFWSIQPAVLESLPFGPANLLVRAALTAITLPLLAFILCFSFAAGIKRKEKAGGILLLACFVLALVPLFTRPRVLFYPRMLLPAMPLFAIAFSAAFGMRPKGESGKKGKRQPNRLAFMLPLLKKAMLPLFCLFAAFSLAYSAAYVYYYHSDYAGHLPLFAEIEKLPPASAVAIHSNKARQLGFLAPQVQAIACSENRADWQDKALLCGNEQGEKKPVNTNDSAELYEKLKALGATHIADTCYHKNPWGKQAVAELVANNRLAAVYSDACSTLYEIK